MEKPSIPEMNSLDSMEGLESKPKTNMSDLEIKIIENGGFRGLSESNQVRFFELYTDHSKTVSEKVCKQIEASGVTNFFDTNFWEEFFTAEIEVVKEGQKKDVKIVQFRKNPELQMDVEVSTGKVETAKELYGTIDDTLIFHGERDGTNSMIEYCDSRPRLSKVLPHFLFNSLVLKGLTEEGVRGDFMRLFDITTQSTFAEPVETESGQPPIYSVRNEALKEEKRAAKDNFFGKLNDGQKEVLLEYIGKWQYLCSMSGKLAQEIINYGSYAEAEKNIKNTFVIRYVIPKWSEKYDNIINLSQFIEGAESTAKSMRKFHELDDRIDTGNVIGHDLSYASRLKEAIMMT